jgi:large conductance mechanosensitive channel
MGIIKEFREFAVRGNVIDLAIGVVIGTAFGRIVSSLVGDVISPLIGRLAGGVSFVEWQVSLGRTPDGETELWLRFGSFLQTIFDFTIIAIALFVAIKGLNRLRAIGEAGDADGQRATLPAPTPPNAEAAETLRLLSEIRDLLKNQSRNA